MRVIHYLGAGGPEVLATAERPEPAPGAGQVLVAVRYAGLNPADVAQREGRYPAPAGAPPDVGGIEVAGTVLSCGPGVTRWAPGDRVFGLVDGGGFAERVVVPELLLAATPDHLTDEEAAAVPEAFITAHDALVRCGDLRPGDRVLVTGANGGVGSAAVQLARSLNAEVVASSRSKEGLQFLESLGAQAVLQDELLHGPDEALGRFDVVVELVGGPFLARDLQLLSTGGSLVLVGVPAGEHLDAPMRVLMRRRARIVGTNLRNRPLHEKATAVTRFADEVVPLLASGSVRPLVDSVHPWTEAVAAFQALAGAGKRGKVLIAFD